MFGEYFASNSRGRDDLVFAGVRITPDGLATCDCGNHYEGFFSRDYGLRKRRVGWFVGEVFFAGEEAQESAALESSVIADRALQHGIAGFKRIEHGSLCHRSGDLQ